MELKIKDKDKKRLIAFGKTGKPLGERSQDELLDLAIIGRSSRHKMILGVFDKELPSLEDLKKEKMRRAEGKSGEQTKTPIEKTLQQQPAATNEE